MDNEELLRQAVREDPANDTPRLAYADYLDERGLPGDAERAELVRVQIELSRGVPVNPQGHTDTDSDGRWFVNEGISCGRADCPRCQLRRREDELLANDYPPILGNRSRWRNGVEEHNPYGWLGVPGFAMDWCTFRRGFIEEVECNGDTWVEHGDRLCQTDPVRRVFLSRPPRTEQDGLHIWLKTKPKLDKNRWRLGGYVVPALLGTCWPAILFRLPNWPHDLLPGERIYWIEQPRGLRQGDWFLNDDHTYTLVVGYASGGLQTVRRPV